MLLRSIPRLVPLAAVLVYIWEAVMKSIALALVCWCMSLLGGCAGGDRVGARTELRMLEPGALVGYAGDGTESAKILESLAPL